MKSNSFSDILIYAIQHECSSIVRKEQTITLYTKVSEYSGYRIVFKHVDCYGLIVTICTPRNYTYVFQYLYNKRMLYDIYDDNITGYNNIYSRTCIYTLSEEQYFQDSTVHEMWYTLDDVHKLEDLRNKLKNEHV